MVKNDNNKVEAFKLVDGESFVIQPNQQPITVIDLHDLQPNEIIVTNRDATFILIKDGVEQVVNIPCPSCSISTPNGIETVELDNGIVFNGEAKNNTSFSADDIESLQNAILAGQDPTTLFEAAAAGNESAAGSVGLNGSSATASFITINYDNDAVLAEAGFDTAYDPHRATQAIDPRVILAADGGELGSMVVVEGDLEPQTGAQGYPVQTSTSIVVDAATLPLESASFVFDSLSINTLLSELNNEISSGGQAVSFIFDTQTNSIIGTLNGTTVMSITLDASSTNGRDVTVNITTTINQPIDHVEGNSSGLVSRDGDNITVDVAIQGADSNGNPLDQPISVDITIKDGANPEFSTDKGTTIDETIQNGQIISGDVPLDVGSDAIQRVDFNADQPNLAHLTSNGVATTFTVSGNVLTVVDSNDKPVMVVIIAKDGSYTVEVTGPIDQNDTDIANINLGVTATDNDGDSTQGQVVITVTDGSDAGGNEHGDITITEGDLTPQAGEQGYPVVGTTTIAIKAGSDRLDPTKVTIDPKQLTDLINELSSELTTGDNQAISFSYDSATGQLVGVTTNGEQVVTVSLTAVQAASGHDIDVTVTITQDKPLNHTDSGVDGLVDSINDKITIDVPIQVQDTDGDWLQKPANVDITIKDGANPEFGTDSGTTINETTQNGQIINGDVPLDVGSDAIHQLDFNADQPSLTALTSNGAATTFTVNGNVLTVVDSNDKPVMVVTIAKDGSYTVEVTGPIDQNDADIATINLNVTATDNDGDSTQGQVVITVIDGSDAGGNEHGDITITEGDLTPQAGEQGYPVVGSTTIAIEAGADRLDPTKVTIDPKQLTALIGELESELTTGDNQAISFSYDSATGQLVGVTAGGEQVVTVSLSATQAANGHDIDVTVTITQEKPLNHTDSGVDGLVDSVNDKITIDVPIQAQDTDGDWLQKPANVDITIQDGANPEFGTDNGITINETTQNGQIINGDVPLDVGSDAIHQLDFNADQPSLTALTSNGAATTFIVNGNVLTVVDSNDKPVMVVTIAKDGSYTVEVTGSIDQNDADIANINLGVTATDNDGDSTQGQVVITVTDGSDAGGNEHGDITITEGDLTPQANEHGYPVSGSTTIAIEAGSDRIDPTKVTIDPKQLTALIGELESELTTGDNQAISFSYDSATGQLVGVTTNGEQVVTVSLTAVQAANGHDIDVKVTITQDKPLNHTDSGVDGLVDSINDKITIDVPIQVQDTDGDWLQKPANVDITIQDGANPEFGTDNGITINETTQNGQIINGDVPLDVGSDAIQRVDFNAEQPSLQSITSNGEATSFSVNGNVLTVVDSNDKPVMVVTIANDGSYTVEVTGPIDQNDADIANINLGVTATDNDGDSTQGQVVITVTDGSDAGGNEHGDITITEGDLTPQAGEQGYPVVGTTTIAIEAGADRLDPTKVTIDPKQLTDLINELSSELTTGDNQAISFSYDSATGQLVGVTAGGEQVVTVSLSATQAANGHDIDVTVMITQDKPLNHTDSGVDGLVDSINDKITIDVPIQVQDTDGDWLQKPANVDITIVDGANPEFGTDSGTTINETTQNGQIINGDVPLDVGSDAIHQLDFNADQPSLTALTSNGAATTFIVNGNVLTVVDSNDKPVMVVTIAKDGSYTVEVTGSIDQNDADIANINLGVTATDNDGDSTQGQVVITVTDGSDAGGNEHGDITITEGDLTPQAGEQGYPVVGTTTISIEAGADRLDPTKVTIDPKQLTDLINELSSELTTGDNQAISFSYDSATGQLVGVTAGGEQVVTVSLSATQAANGHDIDVIVTITQDKPLNHTDSGVDGFVDSINDKITIDVPIQVQDTDGDWLQKPANVDITIVDGANPEFGTDNGTTINETTQNGQVITGDVPLDVGSDAIQRVDFNADQPNLANLTSNGAATTFTVNGNVLTVVDSNDKSVMVVTIANDGSYTVEVTGPIDQNDADIATINLNVTATDNDGDSTQGQVVITVIDGSDAGGNEHGDITITEGDLTPQAGEQGYPVVGTTTIAIEAGADRLDPTKVTIDPKQLTNLINELSSELTTGDNQAISFSYDSATGQLVGVTAGGEQVVTVSLSATQATNGHDIDVTVTITQDKPLNHTDSGVDGLVDSVNDKITIDVPIQAQDTDGDWLQKPANVDITIKDGANPEFGIDSGTTIIETENGTTTNGKITVDVGSDNIAHIHFLSSQPSLDGIVSNNQATRYIVDGNDVRVVIDGGENDGEAVLTITIGNDGSYTVEQHQPIEQNNAAGDSVNINLAVVATDDDGDTSNTGQLEIHIKDGLNPTGEGVQANITITEGDLENPQPGKCYPVVGTGHFTVDATDDALVAHSLTIIDSVKAALLNELNDLTSEGKALSFSIDIDANGIITMTGITASGGQDVVTIMLTPIAQSNGDVSVDMSIIQQLPLDHLSANGTYVDVNGGQIIINVPVQMQDTDGDALQQPVDVVVTIKDGADPTLGIDSGTTIIETENGTTANGKITVDVGSDNIDHINFLASQPSLDGIVSNNQATRYIVDGNEIKVVIDGGTNDGEAVLTITIGNDGSYIVEQHQPIEQDNTAGDSVHIELGVVATDDDGDSSNTGQLEIYIKDGLNPTGDGVQANITITEGDLENPQPGKGYPVVGTGQFTVDATDDALVANSLTITNNVKATLLTELNGLTSGGEALTFSINIDVNGVITITGITAIGAHEAVTITLTPTAQANGDVSVDMSITQQLPLDHLSTDGTYVDVNGGNITINVPVQMQDTDGDTLQQPVDVNITINDGQLPSFGHDTSATLNEGASGQATGSGSINVDTGSDQVVKVYFGSDQASLNGLTSNGHATTYHLSADGTRVVVVLQSDPSQVVMEISIDINGHYVADQKQPIDQVDDKSADDEIIKLDVYAQDHDGDVSKPGQITINIHDGNNAAGGENGTITITEGDLTPTNGQQGYPVSGDINIAVTAGVDRLDPATATIDNSKLTALIDELQSELTANGAPISFVYDHISGVLTGTANGQIVFTVTVTATQAANGHDADIKVSITQHSPLDHNGSDNGGWVNVDGDKIVIDVPVQVKDTDGDLLTNDVNAQITIEDGAGPIITAAPALTVEESDLASGTTPSGNGESALGDIIVNSGSDHVVNFKVDIDSFNQQNDITSHGHKITLSQSSEGTYQGIANGNVVFTYYLLPTGRYIFQLHGTLDHPTQGEDQLTIEIPVYAIDKDGDVSGSVNIDVTVKDDIPSVHNVTLATVEDSSTTQENVITAAGADGAEVTALIVDGQHIALSSLEQSGEYRIYEVKDGTQVLGDLMIKPNGDTYFIAKDNISQTQEDLIKEIGFEVTDGDGDTATGTITLDISDKDATLQVENSIGEEEDGRHSTDATDNVDPNRGGIEINMTIDGGDNDRGEHVGTVTIQPQTQAHGVFMYNGQPLTVNSDGSVTLPPNAFTVDTTNPPDVKFILQGVTFVPDADYSTSAAGIKFDVTAQVNTTDGGNHPVMNGEFAIDVQGIADTPIWNASSVDHYVTAEDQDNVLLNVVADLQDTDGSETLFYFITVPVEYQDKCTLEIGGQLLVETSPGSGVYKVTANQMGSVEVNPVDNFSGDIKLTIQAQSKENSNFVAGHQTADSVEKTVIINVSPVADDAVLKVTRVEANEDQRIDLSNHINLTSLDDNTDNSEHLFLQISALPDGAVLYLNDQLLTPNADGVYEISYQDLNGLSMQPPLDSNVDFSITVNGIVRDVAQVTDANGNVTTETSEKIIGPQTIDVALTGVVDHPEIISENSDWTPLDDGRDGLQTTIKEDGEAKFDFKVISGEHTNADGNTDGSETLSVIISGIPKGTEIYDAEGNLQTLVYAGEDSNGQPIYQVNLDSLTNIVIKPPQNSTEDISLDVRTVVTENDGASAEFGSELIIHITPEIDATDYTTVSNGLEDEATIVNWQPSLSDPQEHITGLALGGLPTGYQLFINGIELNTDSNGNVELTAQQLQTLLDGGQLTVTAPHNSDQDIQLTSTVTVSQTDVDGNKETVTKDITGTLDVDIKAVVEPDGKIVIDDNGTLLTTIASGTDGVIDLSNDAGSDGKIAWQNNDTSSSEVITQIVLDPIPEGFVIIGGINNGNGSWTVPQSSLDGLKIIAPEGFNGQLTLNINALVQDMSDDGDVSDKVSELGEITLDFSANTENNTEKAAEIVVDDSYVVTGTEDHSVDLGKQMMDHIVTISTANGDQAHDDFTLVINADNLPAGATISGADFDHVTGEYVLKVPVAADGTVDLSSITLNLPADYAGDFKFDVKYVTTDSESGDYKTQTDTIAVQVAPQVDGPKDVAITVVETDGLNADKQPISTSDDKQEQVYDNIAYEDGDIKLDLSISLKDADTSETDGKETVQSVTLTLADTSNGVFIDADGNVLGTSITVDQSQLDNIHFRPALDFSGKVDINVSTAVVDTAIYDDTTGAIVTDSKSFDSTVSFDVIAVNDEIKWQGIDTPIVGNEDTAIPLAGISGSLEDVDGSEHIVSMKLENVPDGFIIEGAVNNGDGVWTITASGESFDLSDIKVRPPHDFSGTVDIDIVVYSKEDSLDKPAENRETITIDVNPVADKVDTDVTPNVSGDENSPITLDLGIKAYDDKNTINNPGSNVHENGAESLQITITNVPDSSSFTLPDGVDGSAEKQADGSWIIKVTGSDLDSLIFHPGDANNQTVIDGTVWNGDLNLDIRAVDNGVVGTDSVAVDKTIHVDVTPDNDAPVNHLPSDSLTVAEDATLVIHDLQITDVDSNDHDAVMDMTVTLSVEHGQLAITAGVDTSGLTITDNGDGKLVINGDLTLINQLLDQGINYTGDKDFNGTDSLTMTTDDNGNSGAGGALTDTDSIDITVTPVNDAPINTVPAPFDVNEDGSHVITGLKIADVDAKESGTSGQMTVELNVGHGQLSIIAADTQGLTITDNGDGKLVISGDIDKINTLLDSGIKYTSDANFNGSDQLTMTTSDNGNVGSGGVLTDVSTVDITVTAVNDAPINTVPAPFDVNEDSSHIITGLKIADVDAKESGTSGQMTVELNVEHGQLTIVAAETQGLTISDNGDGKLVISGDIDKINTLLDGGIEYSGDQNYNGSDKLTMTTSDNGNVGSGGVLTDVSTVDITVTPVNDAPVNTVPAAFDVDEDSSHIITGLSITDVDAKESATSGQMTVELNVEHGQLTIVATETQGLTITDNGDGKLVISGDIDKINTLLNDGIEYSGDQNYNGSDKLTMTTSDNGNVGSGGVLTDVSTVDITVAPVNDAPVNEVPATISTSEDTATVIDGIKVTDVDFNELANNDAMSVTLSVNHGALSITLPMNSGVEVANDGSGNVILKGSMTDINVVLDSGISYTAAEHFSGSDELTITTNDGGNTGSGGSLSSTNKVNITVAPKVDMPSLSLHAEHIQTAAIQSSLGTMIPLIGLIAAASADASETLTVKISDLGSAQVVDKAGNVIGTDLGNGNWQVTAQDLNEVYINDLEQGTHTISVTAVSTESNGSQVMSPPVNLNIVVDDLCATNNILGQHSSSDQANLVIDSTAQATLLGGDGNDILVGGVASDILVGGRGDDILWGGHLNGHCDDTKDTFLWSDADFGTANAPATDTIMDFEVGIDVISLGDALNSQNIQSLDDLSNRINIIEQQGNTEIQIFDDQHQMVQNIILNGVNHNELFGDNSLNMSNEDKLGSLMNSGNLELSDNFGNQQDNTLVADSQGESLFGFDGNDILVAGEGNDILTGGNGDDIFTWHESSLSTVSNTDTITDFELDKDQINVRGLLTDDDNTRLDMDDLLKHVSADVDDKGHVNIEVNSSEGQSQHIVLENINPQHDLGLADGASSADIVSSLFSHNAFQVDNNH
ncbi:retention module-containing protein [Photobacterium phosphoreum]|uniref:retention module-containing protein n=1 Tax=Photobacterium phosphoreum TaxID=659 RepID=UPI0011B26064|nr:retention module-containing protein [Photobacterium phosphoreum]